MYITSECYGITRMLNIKCPLYTSIVIHDVILGTKKEPACPSNTSDTPNPLLNPMCCRPSCNDCFQRADIVVQEIEEQCNGLNYCDVPPKLGTLGLCDKNQTEYMAVAYNCKIASKPSDNTTALFSIEEDLCGRSRNTDIVSQVETTTLSVSIAKTNYTSTTTVSSTTLAVPNTTSITTSISTLPIPSSSVATTTNTTEPPTVAPVVTETKNKSVPSTKPLTGIQTTILHRTPTKRFVPTSRMNMSSTSTSSTRLIMANLPGPGDSAGTGPLNKGAMIGGVAAAAGLLVFVLSLVMLRRRRRKLHPRLSNRDHIFNNLSDDYTRAGQIASPVDEIATPTSLSEEGQTPWRFGPPDLNYATIHTDGGHIPVNIQDITPAPVSSSREHATIRPMYAVVDRRISTTSPGTATSGSELYDQLGEHLSGPSFQAICPNREYHNRAIPKPPPLPTKPKKARQSQQSIWQHKQNTAPRYSGPMFSDIAGTR